MKGMETYAEEGIAGFNLVLRQELGFALVQRATYNLAGAGRTRARAATEGHIYAGIIRRV